MNDEIKEHMRNCIDKEESCLLNSDNTKLLLDYITNLQAIEREYSTVLSENAELQQENERLKAKTKEQSLLLIDYQDMEQRYNDYKCRCEKAIEYIKNDWYKLNTRDIEHCVNLGKDIRIDLLNILQNGDNNNE